MWLAHHPLQYGEIMPKCQLLRDWYWAFTGKNDGFWLLWGIYQTEYYYGSVNQEKKILVHLAFADW